MDSSPAGYLSLALLPEGLLACPDTLAHQSLVIEQEMLLQSGIRDIAKVGGLLDRNVTIPIQ